MYFIVLSNSVKFLLKIPYYKSYVHINYFYWLVVDFRHHHSLPMNVYLIGIKTRNCHSISPTFQITRTVFQFSTFLLQFCAITTSTSIILYFYKIKLINVYISYMKISYEELLNHILNIIYLRNLRITR